MLRRDAHCARELGHQPLGHLGIVLLRLQPRQREQCVLHLQQPPEPAARLLRRRGRLDGQRDRRELAPTPHAQRDRGGRRAVGEVAHAREADRAVGGRRHVEPIEPEVGRRLQLLVGPRSDVSVQVGGKLLEARLRGNAGDAGGKLVRATERQLRAAARLVREPAQQREVGVEAGGWERHVQWQQARLGCQVRQLLAKQVVHAVAQ
mmetsp:Transcript_23480/g.54314  ORF Transcript_23480/g.54314 Transcript_23480/m.54314 type:complete len:206 (+) Transcript_23480:547-1164(+)